MFEDNDHLLAVAWWVILNSLEFFMTLHFHTSTTQTYLVNKIVFFHICRYFTRRYDVSKILLSSSTKILLLVFCEYLFIQLQV